MTFEQIQKNKILKSYWNHDIEKSDVSESPKFKKVMEEFKNGTLRSSNGDKVMDRSQALAIAYSEVERGDIEKATYADNYQNRKLNRVGQQYGGESNKSSIKEEKGKVGDYKIQSSWYDDSRKRREYTLKHEGTGKKIRVATKEGETLSEVMKDNYLIDRDSGGKEAKKSTDIEGRVSEAFSVFNLKGDSAKKAYKDIAKRSNTAKEYSDNILNYHRDRNDHVSDIPAVERFAKYVFGIEKAEDLGGEMVKANPDSKDSKENTENFVGGKELKEYQRDQQKEEPKDPEKEDSDKVVKSELDLVLELVESPLDIEKAVYADNYKNRKLGRVGQQYGGKSEEVATVKESRSKTKIENLKKDALKELNRNKMVTLVFHSDGVLADSNDYTDAEKVISDIEAWGDKFPITIKY